MLPFHRLLLKKKLFQIFLVFLFFLQDNFRLDLYLSSHVNTLYSKIRNRALIQVNIIVLTFLESWSL